VLKIGHNLKYDMNVLERAAHRAGLKGIAIRPYDDTFFSLSIWRRAKDWAARNG
jgi:hypothetical protein